MRNEGAAACDFLVAPNILVRIYPLLRLVRLRVVSSRGLSSLRNKVAAANDFLATTVILIFKQAL